MSGATTDRREVLAEIRSTLDDALEMGPTWNDAGLTIEQAEALFAEIDRLRSLVLVWQEWFQRLEETAPPSEDRA